ncbi:MAG: hypothetical protein U0X91_18180 [Spirosomataceae bacterium]
MNTLSNAQTPENNRRELGIGGNISITNNGFSNIPSFSLGKPATVINLTVAGKRLSFEPELRFSLEGKPWSFLFWGRYKVVNTQKYLLGVGLHPGFNFKTEHSIVNNIESDYIVTRRYVTGEINQVVNLTKTINTSVYYMYGRGLDEGAARHTHYLALRAGFNSVRLSKEVVLRINPQLFFLNTAYKNGVYVASSISVVKRNWPVYLGAMLNKAIKTDIPSKDFNWNISLNYTFGKTYKTPN